MYCRNRCLKCFGTRGVISPRRTNRYHSSTLSREGTRQIAAKAGWWYAWFDPHGDITGLAPETGPTGDAGRLFSSPGRPDEWLHLACELAGQTMTPARWAQYVADQPYREVC